MNIKYVFVLNLGHKRKVAYGSNLNHAFAWRGGMPDQWRSAWKKGRIKKYTVAEYFKKGFYES